MPTALVRDLQYAVRVCLRNRGFTLVAMLTLGLGIGANTAAFSLIDALFLRPHPHVKDPEEIVVVASAGVEGSLSHAEYREYRAQNHVLSDLAGYTFGEFGLGDGDATDEVQAYLVTPNYFSVLDVRAAVGRMFDGSAGDAPGDTAEAVLSHALWQARFAGDPEILGRKIRVSGAPYTVVGVAPIGFVGTQRGFAPDLWLPVSTRDSEASGFRPRLVGLGRLRPGVSAQAAETEMTVIAQRLTGAARQKNQRAPVWVTPENKWMLRQAPQLAFAPAVVVALVGVVLLTSCVNLGGLLVARAIFRQKEIALRVSLGASRNDIVRQLLTESLVLAMLGGAAGIAIALVVLKGLWRWILQILNLRGVYIDTSVEVRMLSFTLAVTLASTLLFGLLPALRASSVEVYETLKGTMATSRWRIGRSPARTLVACEVALSVVLLVCAGLFVGPLQNASRADLGYPLDSVLLAKINLRALGYRASDMVAFYDAVMRRFDGLPGVEAVALAQGPMGGGWPHYLPRSAFPHQERNIVLARVGPAFFRATRIPLVAGREFDERDKAGSRVAIVSQLVAERQWPGENAVGKLLPISDNERPMLVIGVAKAVKTLPVLPAFYYVYMPPWQEPLLDVPMYLHVRTSATGAVDPRFIERELHALNPALPRTQIRTLRDRIEEGYSALRLATTILAALGASALLLAAIGLYGLTAYVVGERTYEIGVRRALGAGGPAILLLIIGGTMRLVAIGLGMGLLLGVAAGFVVNAIVGTTPHAFAFVAASLLMAATAFVAAYLPARRAIAVDPMAALRCE
jgi:predicted permease